MANHSPRTSAQSAHTPRDHATRALDLQRLSERLFHIANVLQVLYRALPEDKRDEAPVKSLTAELADMSDAIAIEVSAHCDALRGAL